MAHKIKDKKYAVISMDVEDWYHTYFPEMDVDRSQSLLDGLDVAVDIMDRKNIKGSFFVVGEIADKIAKQKYYDRKKLIIHQGADYVIARKGQGYVDKYIKSKEGKSKKSTQQKHPIRRE